MITSTTSNIWHFPITNKIPEANPQKVWHGRLQTCKYTNDNWV
jgi:hypothetical protein